MRLRLLTFCGLCLFAPCRPSAAMVDIIIDDSQAEFTSWGSGPLQTRTGNSSYGDGYRFIQGWGLYDGETAQPDLRSARVNYRLPPGVDLPLGDHLYNVYAWMPAVNWEWHVIDAAGDGSEDFDQHIDWVGAFGNNKQWLKADPALPFDSELGGRWLKLGPGPQADSAADGGAAFHLNPGIPCTPEKCYPEPFLTIRYQPFYEGLIAFDAIRIVQIPEGPLRGDYNDNGAVDAADYTVWRDSLGTSNRISTTTFPYKQFPLAAADGNTDALVNDHDYNLWKEHFGATAAAAIGSAAVPEPATVSLLALASLASIAVGGRRLRRR